MSKGTTMNKEITLTPEGGRFYRAMAFHWITVAVLMPPLAMAMIAYMDKLVRENKMFPGVFECQKVQQ